MADAEIKIVLLPDGRVRISSACMGGPDAVYAPIDDARVTAEVQKLLGEMCARLGEADVAPIPIDVALYAAFNGRNLLALARVVGWPVRRVQQAVFAVGKEHEQLLSLLDAGVSLSPSQQLRLDQLHEAAPQASAAWSQARGPLADISAAARAFGAVRISDLFPRGL